MNIHKYIYKILLFIIIVILGIGWILIKINSVNFNYNNPKSVFEYMFGSNWPQSATFKNWYFSNEINSKTVFYFKDNVKELQNIIKIKSLQKFDANSSDEDNFNLLFSNFNKTGFPNFYTWNKYAGIDDKSKNYIFIFVSPSSQEVVCFSSSW